MTILWAILGRIWPYLLAAFVALGVYAWDDHRCNSACRSQESRADKVQTEYSALQTDIRQANIAAAAQRAADEAANKKATADAVAQATAAETRARNAQNIAANLLAKNQELLARIVVPDVLRDAYNAAPAGQPSGPPTDPGKSPQEGTSPGEPPLTLDVYGGVCTRNKIAMDQLADDYDTLYDYTTKLHAQCERKAP